VRAALEAEIRGRVQQAAPQLVGDLWGRERVTVAFERLRIAADGVEAQVICELYADSVDAFPVAELVAVMLRPIALAGPLGLVLHLEEVVERLAEGMAVCQLRFAGRGALDAALYPQGCAASLHYELALASCAPLIGAAYESHYQRVEGQPEPGESIEDLVP
jgi:hypothetical protein